MNMENRIGHMYGGTAVAEVPCVLTTATFSSPTVTSGETERGTWMIRGLRIFKAGTFDDSMGITRTWTEEHLEQMELHFRLLKEGGYFPNVPIRSDHSWSVRDVVGYFDQVYRDPTDGTFLSSDVEITEPEAYEKWKRGTYRSRSIEIGVYKTNGEAPMEYFPVVMGLAFVDIPAVEGLHSRGIPPGFEKAFNQTKENKMDEQEFLAACAYAQWVAAAEYAQKCADWESAVNYAQALAEHQTAGEALGLTANHGAAPQTLVFSINGVPTADGVAVQAHISSLEQFRSESITSGRTAFIDSLVQHGKIGAPQADSLKVLVNGDPATGVPPMGDAQFTAFKSSYDAMGTAPLFGQFGNPSTGPGITLQTGNAATALDDEIATLEEIVANHKRTNKSKEEIEAMSSFKRLTELKAQKAKG